jgi:outer membrane lipoprotein-sorting protein
MVMREAVLILTACLLFGTSERPSLASERVLDWAQVVNSYAQVKDYTSTYEKEERAISNGEVQRIRLYFRKPLDVRLEWLNDSGRVDQIAVYRDGFNDGQLLARRMGAFGALLGTLRLDPRSARALADSRHPITEVGIGYIIDRLDGDIRQQRVTLRATVEDVLDGQPHDRFDFASSASVSLAGVDGAQRGVAWIDRTIKLPVKIELVDAAGTVLERHRFKDLRLNVGLTDARFTL